MIGTSFDTKGGISSVVKIYGIYNLFKHLPIIYIPTHKDGSKFEKSILALKAWIYFLSLLILNRVALVHVHCASRASFWRKSLFILMSYATRRPLIFHLHGAEFMQFYEHESGFFVRLFIRFILDRATRIVVLSSQWKTNIAKITSNKKIVTIFKPMPIEDSSDRSQNAKQENTLLFLGRLEKRKGIYDLIETVKRLRDDFPNVQLLCGGDGDLEEVQKKAEDLGINNSLKILGWVTGEYKKQLLAESSIYVLPSYNEGLPMSVLEAMAAGLPIVSTPVGGIPNAVEDGKEGFLVEPGDVAALTETIARLLRDSELRAHMGSAGRKKVHDQFSPEVILPQIEALYQELGHCPKKQNK